MHPIQAYVQSLPFSPEFQRELTVEALLKQHELYLRLPYLLAPLFPQVTPAQVDQLGISSYLYFRFLLTIDALLDGNSGRPAEAQMTLRVFTYCDLFEKAIRGLTELFAAGDPFWADLDRCKAVYAGANCQEKFFSQRRGEFSQAHFERLAAGKSAVCSAIVYALTGLGQDHGPERQLLQCLEHLHIGLQYFDDVEDFRVDWEQGQYTYAHALVEQYLVDHAVDLSQLDSSQLHPYLYTSGTASALLSHSEAHYRLAIEQARQLGLAELAQLLESHVDRVLFYRADIEDNLQQARQRVLAQRVVASSTPDLPATAA